LKTTRTFILSVSLGLVQPAIADVQVSTIDGQSGKSEIKISQTWAKITDLSAPEQYMLIDMAKNTVYMVDNENRMVISLEDVNNSSMGMPPGQMTPQKPKVDIVKVGNGPTVAGYNTSRYQLKANGIVCSEHLISKAPLKHAEIKSFSQQMKKQSEFDDGMNFGSSPCELAEREFDKRAMDYGVPLLSKDANGTELFRINEIKTGITISKSEFNFPKGYQRVSQKELMQRQMEQAMPNRSLGVMDIESGKIPSEEEMKAMQEQLMQLQEMMKSREDQ